MSRAPSSSRKLSENFAWDDESRSIELLDWENKPEDFDRLYARVVGLLVSREGWTHEKLSAVVSEGDLHREVRNIAGQFQERLVSLPMFIYLRLKFLRLPQLRRRRRRP